MTSIQEAYLAMQGEYGIRIGDTVKVLRASLSYEMGWGASWNPEMDAFIGWQLPVTGGCIDRIGIRCTLPDGRGVDFPFFMLGTRKEKEKPISVQIKNEVVDLSYLEATHLLASLTVRLK